MQVLISEPFVDFTLDSVHMWCLTGEVKDPKTETDVND